MLDYTTDPPMYHVNTYVKENHLPLLKPAPSEKYNDGDGCDAYSIPQLAEMTRYLMHVLQMSYDSCRDSDIPRRSLEDFSEAERRLYYPFAFMLACLAGNAFRTGQISAICENPDPANPSAESISQYIPDAAHIMKLNSADEAELRAMIAAAAQG